MRSGEWIVPGEYTDDDLVWLGEASRVGPEFEQVPLDTIFQQHMDGDLQIVRLKSPASGVVIVQVLAGAYGNRRLLIRNTAGTNTIQAYPEIIADMLDFAQQNDCEAIETSVYDTRLAMVLRKLGCIPETVTMTMEVPRGSQ